MKNERLRELISPKVGIIREIGPQGRGAEEPMPPYLYTATLSNFDFRVASKVDRIAAGKGVTLEDAIAAAIGEATERYCAYHWDPRRTYLAKWSDLKIRGIKPQSCVLYSEAQYQTLDWHYARWIPDQELAWINGIDLLDGSPVALPASLVYLVFPPPRMEDYFAPSTSNGLAAGETLASAALGGLCELMERDAMLITWMNRLPAVELQFDEAAGLPARIHRHYAHFGVNVRAFLMPSDLPAATVMAISFEDDPARPANVVGLGCHPDPKVALLKAVFELCQGRPAEGARFIKTPPHDRLKRYEDVQSLEDHSAFMSQMNRRHEFEFLWQTGESKRVDELPNPSTGDAKQDLELCAADLAAKGYRGAFAELTTPDLVDYGVHVVRVIVPELQPVHFGHGQERLGGQRLFTLPQQLGFAESARSISDLNPCPHPLA
ncbi:MAG TPA: YcaO-like family protein [Pyrinomonadaceae bacterium]|nr:YcaO-like family protein [Pyrinomonadaceae bacterium]